MFSIDEEDSIRSSMRESEDDRKKKLENERKKNMEMDLTPHPGTPPNYAPEDAFRNIHRQYDSKPDMSDDPISKQIEEY
jgi:hypothetical protein